MNPIKLLETIVSETIEGMDNSESLACARDLEKMAKIIRARVKAATQKGWTVKLDPERRFNWN